jgi:glycosyltransferase involved in cell wall biosynthesis
MPKRKPLRVLHVLGELNTGGAEVWLLQVMRRMDPARFRFDFAVHVPGGTLEKHVKDLGGRIVTLDSPHAPHRYVRSLYTALSGEATYDVVHSHIHHYSGVVLSTARIARVPCRIAHSHLTSAQSLPRSAARTAYYRLSTVLIRMTATTGLAASNDAAADLFGDRWRISKRWITLPCGIDLEPFQAAYDRQSIRAAAGIAPRSTVLAHVGRFVAQKNHRFLVELASRVAQEGLTVDWMFAGDGPDRPAIEEMARAAGLTNIRFLGVRHDIAQLLSAADAFIFPSLSEGLGLAAVEAQAAGLPCLIGAHLPAELNAVPELVFRAPLELNAWLTALRNQVLPSMSQRERSAGATHSDLRDSDFDIALSAERLFAHYESSLEAACT